MLAQIPGIPGGPEVFILVFIILVFIILVIALVFVLIRSLVRVFGGGADDARIADLERRVAELEREHE